MTQSAPQAPPAARQPLAGVGSVKAKLALLVGTAVVLSTLVVSLAGSAGVPWLLAVPVAVGLALAVTQLLAVGMTSPLREMIAATGRMARGDYEVRVASTADDEVGRLARAFNAMAADLATVDRQRRDLVATVSHELRTPLTGALVTTENLADGVVAADTDTLTGLADQLRRLGLLVEDLLDLSRLEGGATPLEPGPVTLADLLVSAVDSARAGRATDVDVEVEPRDLVVTADGPRLVQVVVNLVDNAVRHSPPDGTVSVRATAGDGGWQLSVTDDGPGVPQTERDHIFERFGTGDPITGGTGLGLAIARRLVELHGGVLQAADRPDELPGACFRASFPASVPAATSAHPHAEPARPTSPAEPAMRPAPTAVSVPNPIVELFSFPTRASARPGLVAVAAGVGLLGALLLPRHDFGVAYTLVLVSAAAVLGWVLRARFDRFRVCCAVLGVALVCVPTWRASQPLALASLLVAALLAAAALTDGRRVADLGLGVVAWGVGPLRGLPWLGRSLSSLRGGASAVAVARTVVLSTVALTVFGLLLTSGDALMGSWVDAAIPDLTVDVTVLRLFIGLFIFAVVLSAVHLALEPMSVWPAGRRRRTRRFEWLAPVLAVDALLLIFLVAQATVFFGGHDYVRRTTGLTYADYVHQGFGQLTAVTVLTLLVVALVTPHVDRHEVRDVRWLRVTVGLMCLLTLVVVTSALHRMQLYQQAYGYTVLRVVVDVFEGWLGLLVLLVMIGGVGLSARWLPRAALVTGAVAVLGLVALNPDAWVAGHNLGRLDEGHTLDVDYLRSLSDDATPTILADHDVPGRCLVGTPSEDALVEWNHGRAAARAAWTRTAPASDCAAWIASVDAVAPGSGATRP